MKKTLIEAPKLVITICDRTKTEFYLDVISQFNVNMQLVTLGKGTASTKTLEMLGLSNSKGIIFSIVPSSMVHDLLETLSERFKTIKKGNGVSAVLSISSVIGKALYQFMINNRERMDVVNE